MISITKVTTETDSSPSPRRVKMLPGAAGDRTEGKAAAQVQGASLETRLPPAKDWSPLETTSQESRTAGDETGHRYTHNRAQARSRYLDLSLDGAYMA